MYSGVYYLSAVSLLVTLPSHHTFSEEDRKGSFRTAAQVCMHVFTYCLYVIALLDQAAIHFFSGPLSAAVTVSTSGEVRVNALWAIKQVRYVITYIYMYTLRRC